MHSILVKDYMDPNPHAIHISKTVIDVVKLLINENILGAPVVNDENHLVGFVSEQDCMIEMLNDTFYCEESPPISAVMSRDILTVSPETSILEMAETMSKRPPKNYPVVDNGRLIGILSRRRVLKALLETNEDCYIHY